MSAHVEQQGGQNVLVYRVKERPQITDVKLYGMKAIRSNDDKIVAAMKVHPGAILDPVAVKETINDIEQVYADKGYTDAKVTFKPIPQPDNTAFGEFDVGEGHQGRDHEDRVRRQPRVFVDGARRTRWRPGPTASC